MKKISKQAETRLMQAIEKIAVLVNTGETPSAAIAKVAREDGIPPGHVNLMVHAYNTGRTTRQRVDGADALEKAADFPLADAATVLELMYPATVKTAAALQQAVIVSTEYAIPPTGILQRREKRAIRQRPVDWGMGVAPPEEYPSDPRERLRRAYGASERLQHKVAEARRLAWQAHDKMASTFMELSDYFRRPGASSIPIVTEQVEILHGGKGRQVMDQLVKVTPGLLKFSMHKCADKKPRLAAADGEPYALVSQLLDEVEAYKEKKATYQSIHKDVGERSEALLRPFVQAPSRSVLEDFPSSTVSKKTAGVLSPVLAGAALKSIFSGLTGVPPDAGAVDAAYNELTDPLHEQRLRGIRAQAMLQDLMLNDPVIAGYDPGETMAAYNDIVQISPRAADKRLLMQGLLRSRLSQGILDPHEVSQLVGIEESQRKLTEPSSQQMQESQQVWQEQQRASDQEARRGEQKTQAREQQLRQEHDQASRHQEQQGQQDWQADQDAQYKQPA